MRRDRRLAAVQTSYGALLPPDMGYSRSCSDMSTGTHLCDAAMMAGAYHADGGVPSAFASAASFGASGDDGGGEESSSPDAKNRRGGDAAHLVFGALDDSDGAQVRVLPLQDSALLIAAVWP